MTSLISSGLRRSGLSLPYLSIASLYGMRGNSAGRRNASPIGKLLENTGKHWLQRLKHVFLRHEAHFEVKLVKLGTAISAQIFVTEARRDLEISVEARHHQQLLEHLWRLRKRIEAAGMQAAGHQIVARALRARCGQNRRLDFIEALIGHAAADRGNDLTAQHDILVHRLPPQIDEAVFEADILGIVLLARNGATAGSSASDCTATQRAKTSISPVGRLALTVSSARAFTSPSMVTTLSTRNPIENRQRGRIFVSDDLRQA